MRLFSFPFFLRSKRTPKPKNPSIKQVMAMPRRDRRRFAAGTGVMLRGSNVPVLNQQQFNSRRRP